MNSTDPSTDSASSARPETGYDMHLILNTHWDREYRWSFRETQMRLLEAVDILLDTMERDPRFSAFHPDSQASFLDDYLEMRPERREQVCRYVREGRLLAGPWYTLPAEFVVSGESLVRNLLMGHRLANEWGGVMKVAYNIFSWGQVSQLPQIYRQFGMDTILFYRGIDQSKLERLEFWWEAPDGSRALGHTFGSYHRLNFWVYVYNPFIKGQRSNSSFADGAYDINAIQRDGGLMARMADGYSTHDLNHHVLRQPCKRDIDAALDGMRSLLGTVKDVSSTRNLLFLQGFDQENPDPVVPDLVEAINAHMDYGTLRISRLPDYIQALREGMKENGTMDALRTFHGEMLNVETSDDAFAPLYNGTFSARMPLKLQNADAQYRMERWAEPAASWHFLHGAAYPERVLRMAWKELLQNQQHDGIGGCHVDRVQLTMEERNRTVNDIAEGVTRDALKALTAEIDYSHLGEHELGVTVFNPTGQARSREVLTVTLDVPHAWGLRFRGEYKFPMLLEVEDAEGAPVEVQILGVEDESVYAYLKYGNALRFPATRITAALPVDVPGMGYASYRVKPKAVAHRPVKTLAPQSRMLENEFLRAEILPDGSIDLCDKQTGVVFPGLHVFEDSGECGGPLIHTPPNGNAIYHTAGLPAAIARVCDGPVMAKYRIEREWMLPDGLEQDRKIMVPFGGECVEQGAMKRASSRKVLKIITEVSLKAGSRMLEFVTTVENTITDHRLRVTFPTQLERATQAHVDSPFDVVTRPITVTDSTGWYEAAPRTWPTTSFVDLHDAGTGLAILHYGLSEYEVTNDPTRTIALTLLRCFGTAGNPTETFQPQPLAQCPGTHVFRYAVYPHAGDWRKGRVPHQAQCFTTPLRAVMCTGHTGHLPRHQPLLDMDAGDTLVTALKKAEFEDALVVRGYNPTPEPVRVSLAVPPGVTQIMHITLEEKPVGELPVHEGLAQLQVRPGEIYSIMLRRVKETS